MANDYLGLLPLLSPTLHTLAVTTRPKLGRRYNQNLRGNMPARLKISRPADGRARLTAAVTWDPGSIADGDEAETTVTVTGAALGDQVTVGASIDIADLTLTAAVTAANTVSISLANNTGSAVDLASGSYTVAVSSPQGNVGIYGANLPNPWAGRKTAAGVQLTQLWRGRTVQDGTGIAVTRANAAAGDYTLQSNIPYVAFSNYNWILLGGEIDQLVLQQGTTNGGFGVTDVGGYACFTFSLRTVAADSSTVSFDLAGLPYDLYAAGVIDLQVKNNGVLSVLTTDYTVTSTVDATSGEAVVRVTFGTAPTTGNVTIRPFLKSGAQLGAAFVTVTTIKTAAANSLVDEDATSRDAMWAVMAAPIAPTLALFEPGPR